MKCTKKVSYLASASCSGAPHWGAGFSGSCLRSFLIVGASLLSTGALADKPIVVKLSTPAASNTVTLPLVSVLPQIEEKYKKAGTLSARFDQVNENASTGAKIPAVGTLQVKLPNQLRWETLQPQPNLLVGNGKKFWLYTPPFDPSDPSEHGQVAERKVGDIQSEFASVLLTGAFSGAVSKVKQWDENHYTLTPKKGSAGTVAEAEITVDPKALLITDVTLKHRGGNRSVIHLSRIELGTPLKDDLFEFKAPPNTDKLEE